MHSFASSIRPHNEIKITMLKVVVFRDFRIGAPLKAQTGFISTSVLVAFLMVCTEQNKQTKNVVLDMDFFF